MWTTNLPIINDKYYDKNKNNMLFNYMIWAKQFKEEMWKVWSNSLKTQVRQWLVCSDYFVFHIECQLFFCSCGSHSVRLSTWLSLWSASSSSASSPSSSAHDAEPLPATDTQIQSSATARNLPPQPSLTHQGAKNKNVESTPACEVYFKLQLSATSNPASVQR